MITVMLAKSRAKRVGVDCRIEKHRLVFSKDGLDIGSTMTSGPMLDDDHDFVSEHAVNLILDGIQ